MAAPAAPPVTSVTANAAALIAFMAAHGTDGVYIYTDVGQVPTGAGVTGTALDTALLAAYEADARTKTFEESDAAVISNVEGQSLVITHMEGVAQVLSDLNVYPAGTTHLVTLKAGAIIFDDTETAGEAFVAKLSADTNVYINQAGIPTVGQLWYQIKTGTYANDYVRHEDVQFLSA